MPPTNDFDNVRHPDWHRFIRRWQMAWDFWRGGLCVLEPDHPAVDALFVTERPAGGGSGGVAPQDTTTATRYDWRTVPYNSFLFKHARESAAEYEDRCRRAINMPLFQYVINTLAAGTLRDWPQRDGVTPEWEAIHSDMDLVGTDVDAFMRRALTLGLVFGRVHAVVDMVRPESPARSKLEQSERGERPYTYLVNPQELVDWRVDGNGRLEWGVLMEVAPDRRMPGKHTERGEAGEFQYRVWYRDGWELYRKPEVERRTGAQIYEAVDGGPNPIGEVPIYTLYCTRLAGAAEMGCETPLPDLLDLNRALFNDLSELDDTDRAQAFAILGIPVADGMSVGSVDIGPKRGLMFSSEAGAPGYISADSSIAQGRWTRLQEKAFLGRQLGGVSRGKAEYSKEERSAAAISVEAEDKKNQLAWWSKSLQEFDLSVHRGLAEWMALKDYPRAAYTTNFDTKGTMSSVQELVQLAAVPVVVDAREAQAELAIPLFRKLLREYGSDEEAIKRALDSLTKSGKKKPEPKNVAVPFGGKPNGVQGQKGNQGNQDPAAKAEEVKQ